MTLTRIHGTSGQVAFKLGAVCLSVMGVLDEQLPSARMNTQYSLENEWDGKERVIMRHRIFDEFCNHFIHSFGLKNFHVLRSDALNFFI